jgi:hypothetical protein
VNCSPLSYNTPGTTTTTHPKGKKSSLSLHSRIWLFSCWGVPTLKGKKENMNTVRVPMLKGKSSNRVSSSSNRRSPFQQQHQAAIN